MPSRGEIGAWAREFRPATLAPIAERSPESPRPPLVAPPPAQEPWWQRHKPSAIDGLHSNWIEDASGARRILAMARPSDRRLAAFNVLAQFAEHNVRAIFNLQERGEHPTCGDGINDSGFSYTPEKFMDAGVFYYNFAWRDMGCPELDFALGIVQVMAHTALELRANLAVHCHAGMGRTGLVIACYLVYVDGLPPADAVALVRRCRPGTLQTRSQVLFVTRFRDHVANLRCVLPPAARAPRPSPAPRNSVAPEEAMDGAPGATDRGQAGDAPSPAPSLAEALRRQSEVLHGEARRVHQHVPQLVASCRRSVDSGGVGEEGGPGGADDAAMAELRAAANAGRYDPICAAPPALARALVLEWLGALLEPVLDGHELELATESGAAWAGSVGGGRADAAADGGAGADAGGSQKTKDAGAAAAAAVLAAAGLDVKFTLRQLVATFDGLGEAGLRVLAEALLLPVARRGDRLQADAAARLAGFLGAVARLPDEFRPLRRKHTFSASAVLSSASFLQQVGLAATGEKEREAGAGKDGEAAASGPSAKEGDEAQQQVQQHPPLPTGPPPPALRPAPPIAPPAGGLPPLRGMASPPTSPGSPTSPQQQQQLFRVPSRAPPRLAALNPATSG